MTPTFQITHARVFAIAGPAMLANLTTPLLGLVATAAIGRLGEAHLLGGVALAAVVFVRIWSAPFTLGNLSLVGWLVGTARASIALALQIAINSLNIALTLLLVVWLEFGIAGAALAAVLAEAAGFAIGLAIAWRLLGRAFETSAAVVLARDQLLRMLAVNR